MYFKLGTGMSNEKKPQYEYDDDYTLELYEPGISASLKIGMSRHIGTNFRLSSGVNYDYYSIKSEPFYQVHVGPSYYHTATGIQPYITYDDKLSVKERHRGYLSFPIVFEYHGTRTWSPYFKLGTILSLRVYDRRRAVFQGTRIESSGSTGYIAYSTRSGLFGTFGGGVQYKNGPTTFSFGLTGNVGIVWFVQSDYVLNNPLPNSLQLEVGIHQALFNKRRSK